jgi:hypothetical protein
MSLLLAGDESDASNPLLEDFIVVARKLEKLGLSAMWPSPVENKEHLRNFYLL